MKKIHLSVVIPCYNEERNIRLGALENVAQFFKKKKYPYEVIIVDDGSMDDSLKLIKNFLRDHPKFSLLRREHQGKAGTVIAGMLTAKGEYILFTDLDQATPINQIDKLMPWFKKGYDVVIGSRNTRRRGAPPLRLLMAKGFITLRNLILNLNIEDTQCGFKVFTKKAAKTIFFNLKVYSQERKVKGSTVTAGFDVEVLYIAKMLGLKIAEVPVEWYYQETRRVNPLQDSLDGLVDLFKIRWNSIRGVYKN